MTNNFNLKVLTFLLAFKGYVDPIHLGMDRQILFFYVLELNVRLVLFARQNLIYFLNWDDESTLGKITISLRRSMTASLYTRHHLSATVEHKVCEATILSGRVLMSRIYNVNHFVLELENLRSVSIRLPNPYFGQYIVVICPGDIQ